MRRSDIYTLIFVVLLTGLALWINFAPGGRFLGGDVSVRLGLDLQGGIQVLLRSVDPDVSAEEMEVAAGVIERRVNALGVGETVVQLSGNDSIIVELPGVENPEQAVESLRGTGRLEFIDSQGQFLVPGQTVRTSGNPDPVLPDATEGVTPTLPVDDTVYASITDGADLDTSQVQPAFSQGGAVGSRPAVSFAFRGDSASRLASFTAQNVGQPMCIVLDNRVVSCPVINSPLTDGSGIIETNSNEDRDLIFNQLKFGALPIALQIENSRTVSATLGQESVQASIVAGVVGLMVVAVYMILFYRVPGVLAALALLIYVAVTFAIYRIVNVAVEGLFVLTLPGIAGFILSIGLAVDANVLIFSRLREEFRRRRQLRPSIDPGFAEAWPAIRDSSFTTLITCFILYVFGNSFGVSVIKGFAVTLGMGVALSLFSAIVITRTFLRLTANTGIARHPWLFGLDPEAPRLTEPAAEVETT